MSGHDDDAWIVRDARGRILDVYADAAGLTPDDVMAWCRNQSGDWPDVPLVATRWPVRPVPPSYVEKRREVAAEAARREAAKREVQRRALTGKLRIARGVVARLEAELAALDAEGGLADGAGVCDAGGDGAGAGRPPAGGSPLDADANRAQAQDFDSALLDIGPAQTWCYAGRPLVAADGGPIAASVQRHRVIQDVRSGAIPLPAGVSGGATTATASGGGSRQSQQGGGGGGSGQQPR